MEKGLYYFPPFVDSIKATSKLINEILPKIKLASKEFKNYGSMEVGNAGNSGNEKEYDDKLPILKFSFIENNLQDIINTSISKESPISLIMLDIDHFKKFNDTYGHPIGDDVLKITCSLIKKIVKSECFVVRYGGEEITIILPNYNIEEASALAERVRKDIESYDFIVEKDKSEHITISGGIRSINEAVDYKVLINEADAALREAKSEGRNRICVHKMKKV